MKLKITDFNIQVAPSYSVRIIPKGRKYKGKVVKRKKVIRTLMPSIYVAVTLSGRFDTDGYFPLASVWRIGNYNFCLTSKMGTECGFHICNLVEPKFELMGNMEAVMISSPQSELSGSPITNYTPLTNQNG